MFLKKSGRSDVGLSQKKVDAELKSMTVTVARFGEKTGNLDLQYAAME